MKQKQKAVREDITQILPKRLRELRNKFGYSQSYIAEQLCVKRQTYSHYETGRIIPPADMLCQLANIYEVSIDTLLSHDFTTDTGKPSTETSSNSMAVSEAEKDRYSELSEEDKDLLFYYSELDNRDQKDILDFLEIKYKNRFS